ncbi:unnamed protein product [Meganyctiphanes norvegica]|uniref:F-box domain-containing protein n=1 Tax=Meganyctiphanes norvegica TaxID=48144 RepID=A0AAV2PLQ2_MEGNR
MVLTRLSHYGEVCPLGDHSYSDPSDPSASTSHAAGHNSRCSHVQSNDHLDHSSSSSTQDEDGTNSLSLQIVDGREKTSQLLLLLDLPTEIVEKILSYLTYKQIGAQRMLCKRFEVIGSGVLNSAFQRLQNQMLHRFQSIKAQMPRRESARRKHPLARESDIVETLHMRLTLLQMSFGKHIERKHCCFFAGEILDEVYSILIYIQKTPNLGRAYKVTDELFDLSTMAMEYFKENIEPRLPEITYFGSDFLDMTSTRFTEGGSIRSPSGSGRASEPEDELPEREAQPQSNMVLRKRIRRIRQGMKRYNSQLVALKRELKSCKGKMADQHKTMVDTTSRLEEYDKKFEESSRKFSTLLQELNKCKTELQYWRSKSPAHPLMCYSCGRGVGEGVGQDLQAGVLVPSGGDDQPLLYVPLTAAATPDSGHKSPPAMLLATREEARERWQGASVRNLERAFDVELPESKLAGVPSINKARVPNDAAAYDMSISTNKARVPSDTTATDMSLSNNFPTTSGLPYTNIPSSSRSCPTSLSYSSAGPSRHTFSYHKISSCGNRTISTCNIDATCNSNQSSFSSIPTAHCHNTTVMSGCTTLPHCDNAQPGTSYYNDESKWYSEDEGPEDLSQTRFYNDYSDGYKRKSSGDSEDSENDSDTVARRVRQRKRIRVEV